MDAALRSSKQSWLAPTNAVAASPEPAVKKSARISGLFHQDWWLKAASGGQFSEVKIEEENAIVGRLPYVTVRKFGFTILKMPPFTHVLGPIINGGSGKYQTLLKNRMKIAKKLIENLPKFDYFYQICDPSSDDDLALADGLAFQEGGFRTGSQYTFHIDCRKKLDTLLGQMNGKTRNNLRSAEKYYTIIDVYEADSFTRFYAESLLKKKQKCNIPLERFSDLYLECRARDCGTILAAVDENGAPLAMTFLVWDEQKMYYLLSARDPDAHDRGAVNLLIWKAITEVDPGFRTSR